jgi:hypothetical protein
MYFLLSVGLKFERLITCRMFLPGVLACGPIIALISGGPPQIRLQVQSCTRTDKLEKRAAEEKI